MKPDPAAPILAHGHRLRPPVAGELGWLGRRITRRIADADLVRWGYEPTP